MPKHNLALKIQTTNEFTGSTLHPNKDTGFLEGLSEDTSKRFVVLPDGRTAVSPGAVFNSDKKSLLLKLLRSCWPNITLACKEIGISRQTFNNHYSVDVVFRAAVDELNVENIDEIEGVRFEMARHGTTGVMDRMAVLNAYRKEIYNPDVKIQVNHSMSREEATQRDSVTAHSIDAEIVQTYRKVKNKQAKELAKENKERQR